MVATSADGPQRHRAPLTLVICCVEMRNKIRRRDGGEVGLESGGIEVKWQFQRVRDLGGGQWARAGTPFHLQVEFSLGDHQEAQSLVKPRGPIAFEHKQSNRFVGADRLAKDSLHQGSADTLAAMFGQQGDIHDV